MSGNYCKSVVGGSDLPLQRRKRFRFNLISGILVGGDRQWMVV